MKGLKNIIYVLATVDLIGAVVCFIVMFITMNQKEPYWPTYLTSAISLLVSAFVFAFISDLGDRADKIEAALKRNGIDLEEKRKVEPQQYEPQKVFRAGEPIRIKSSDKTGMVKVVLDNNEYQIELDEDRGNIITVNGEDLKSYFDK